MAGSKHRAVNWVDGMKISRQHFVETDNHHLDQVRGASLAMLTPFSYGLSGIGDGSESLEMQVLGDAGQHIRIRVERCHAITPDGSMIDVSEFDDLSLDTSLAQIVSQYHLTLEQNLVFYIVLSVNLFDRKAVGDPIDTEIPFRHPHTSPGYQLHIIPALSVNAAHWGGANLPIGKMEYANGELRVVQEYIPACRIVKGHRGLREWYNTFGGFLNDIETSSFRILQKIKLKSQKSTLSDSVEMLTVRSIDVLAVCTVPFQRLVPYHSPLNMLVVMIQLVQSIRTSIECLTDREKEELLGYLGEWADEAPGSIEKQILAVIQVPYNHIEITDALRVINNFYIMWTALFTKLSQLEFIGKRKGQQVFIIESPVHDTPAQPEKARSRWSPL